MPRYAALHRYWDDIPPVEVSVAAYLRIGMFNPHRPSQFRTVDSRGLPIVDKDGKPLPPTLDEKPGTLEDLARLLKSSGKQSLAF